MPIVMQIILAQLNQRIETLFADKKLTGLLGRIRDKPQQISLVGGIVDVGIRQNDDGIFRNLPFLEHACKAQNGILQGFQPVPTQKSIIIPGDFRTFVKFVCHHQFIQRSRAEIRAVLSEFVGVKRVDIIQKLLDGIIIPQKILLVVIRLGRFLITFFLRQRMGRGENLRLVDGGFHHCVLAVRCE